MNYCSNILSMITQSFSTKFQWPLFHRSDLSGHYEVPDAAVPNSSSVSKCPLMQSFLSFLVYKKLCRARQAQATRMTFGTSNCIVLRSILNLEVRRPNALSTFLLACDRQKLHFFHPTLQFCGEMVSSPNRTKGTGDTLCPNFYTYIYKITIENFPIGLTSISKHDKFCTGICNC